jgi:hypothetical protein
MTEWGQVFAGLETWIRDYGASAIFLLLAGESLGLPLPGESLLITAAILAGRGNISFTALFFSAWAGAVTAVPGTRRTRCLSRAAAVVQLRHQRQYNRSSRRCNKSLKLVGSSSFNT